LPEAELRAGKMTWMQARGWYIDQSENSIQFKKKRLAECYQRDTNYKLQMYFPLKFLYGQ